MRLIDADALLKVLNMEVLHYADNGYDEWLNGIRDGLERAMDTIEETPAVDAEPVRHGEWIFGEIGPVGSTVKCSECGLGCKSVNKTVWLQYQGHKRCGNCGAKMDAKDINVPTKETNKICPINKAPCNECVPGAYCAKLDGGKQDGEQND